jgi:hypothetical protein
MTTNDTHRAVETPEQVQEAGIEMQRSARQVGRTAYSLAETVRAVVRDSGFALLGLGDVTARALRDVPRLTARLPDRIVPTLVAAGRGLGETIAYLCERGQGVMAQVRHDPGVRSAVRRTQAAGGNARTTVRSMRRAARAQARGARRSAAALGRTERSRYRHMPVVELRDLAARREVEGRSRMDKRELIAALQRSS